MWPTFKTALTQLAALTMGALSCALMQKWFSLSPVLASAVPTLLASFLFTRDLPLQSLFYIGSFVAMSGDPLSDQAWFFPLALLVSYSSYRLLDTSFTGLGGKLGTIAFLGTLTCSLLAGFVS